MRSEKSRITLASATVAASLLMAASAQAANIVHNRTSANDTWTTATWTNGVPNAAGDVAATTTTVAATTTTLDTSVTIGVLRNDLGSGAGWTIQNGVGNPYAFTMDGTGLTTPANHPYGLINTAALFVGSSGSLNVGTIAAPVDLFMSNTDLFIGAGTSTGQVNIVGNVIATTNQNLNFRTGSTSGAGSVSVSGNIGASGAGTIVVNGNGTGNRAVTVGGNLGPNVIGLNQTGNTPLFFNGLSSVVNGNVNIASSGVTIGNTSARASTGHTINGDLGLTGGTFSISGFANAVNGNTTLAAGSTIFLIDANPPVGMIGGGVTTLRGLNGAGGTINTTGGGGLNRTLTIGASDAAGSFAGTLTDTQASSRQLIVNKNGAGTQILSGTLSYGGATTINAGKLIIDGTQTRSAITVLGSGTLGGTGSVFTVNVNGTLTPGGNATSDTTAILDFSGRLALNGAAQTTLDIDGTAPEAGHDQVRLNSTIASQYGGGLTFDFGVAAPVTGAVYDLFNFGINPVPTGSFSLITLAGVYSGTLTDLLGTGVYTGQSGSTSFAFSQLTGDLTVAVPEPTTLGALGLASLLLRRRR